MMAQVTEEKKVKDVIEILDKIGKAKNDENITTLEAQLREITGRTDIVARDYIEFLPSTNLKELAQNLLVESIKSQNESIEFLDTQILIRSLTRTDFTVDIDNKKISSIVALEFLNLISIIETHPKIGRFHSYIPYDSFVIDLKNEFDSFKISLNQAIANFINGKSSDYGIHSKYGMIDNSISSCLSKKEYKVFREKVGFLFRHKLTVTPVNKEIVELMLDIYNNIKSEYNIKKDYKNSFRDLLIVSTAIYNNSNLITVDKELNRILTRYSYVDVVENNEIQILRPEKTANSKIIKKNDIKNYINSSWLLKK